MQVREKVDLQNLNTLAVPSSAEYFCEPESVEEINSAVGWAKTKGCALQILGGGSNVVLPDQISGLVIKPKLLGRELSKIVTKAGCEEAILRLGAGENWHEIVSWCLHNELYGLERLALIPGTVGAAPVQNIGAYGVELSQFVEQVEYFDYTTCQTVVLNAQQCSFAYRDSIFKHQLKGRALITHLSLRLSTDNSVITRLDFESLYPPLRDALSANHGLSPTELFEAVCAVRRSKLPAPEEIPNSGSFFKNPLVPMSAFKELIASYPEMPFYRVDGADEVKLAAGWLIEQAGWKGKGFDGAMVHDKQALVLTNPGRLPARHVLALANQVSRSIQEKFGIQLEVEPQLLK